MCIKATVFFAFIFVTILGCTTRMQQMLNITERDYGKTLTISNGQQFILILPNRVDGGYRFDKANYDSAILRLEKYTETPPPADSSLGNPGKAAWQFIVLKNGKAELKITATRPWKGGGTVTIFENIIMVN